MTYGVTQLGTQQSQLGIGALGLGAPPVNEVPQNAPAGSAEIRLRWATMGRVTEVATEVAIQPPPPYARTTEVAAEALVQIAPPYAKTTELAVEAAVAPPPPYVRTTRLWVEALVYAPTTLVGSASILVASLGVLPYGSAYMVVTSAPERELVGHASIRAMWAVVPSVPGLAAPTVAPTVTITHNNGGTLPAGNYQFGYTWKTAAGGQTLVSPLTTVTLALGDTVALTWPAPPAGTEQVVSYISGAITANKLVRNTNYEPPLDNPNAPAIIVPLTHTTPGLHLWTNYHNNYQAGWNEPSQGIYSGLDPGGANADQGVPPVQVDGATFNDPTYAFTGWLAPVVADDHGTARGYPPGGAEPLWGSAASHPSQVYDQWPYWSGVGIPPVHVFPRFLRVGEHTWLVYDFDLPAPPPDNPPLTKLLLEVTAALMVTGAATVNGQYFLATTQFTTSLLPIDGGRIDSTAGPQLFYVEAASGLVESGLLKATGNRLVVQVQNQWTLYGDFPPQSARGDAPGDGVEDPKYPPGGSWVATALKFEYSADAIIKPPPVGALTPPPANWSPFDSTALDHDYRSHDPNDRLTIGTRGWRAGTTKGTSVVVRSGEQDVATMPTFVAGRPALTNPIVSTQPAPVGDPGSTWTDSPPADLSVLGLSAHPIAAGTMVPGIYMVGYTWVNPGGQETVPSPVQTKLQPLGLLGLYQVDTVTLAAGQGGIRFESIAARADGAVNANDLVGVNVYVSGPTGRTQLQLAQSAVNAPGSLVLPPMFKQTSVPLLITGGVTPVFDLTTPPATTTGTPPLLNQWTPVGPPDDGAAKKWYDLDYVAAMDPKTIAGNPNPDYASVTNRLWRNPIGGYRDQFVLQQGNGLAFYNPNWRAIPTAPTMVDPAVWPGTSDLFGVHLFYRHTWTQPAGAVPRQGLLTLRFTGVMDHLYINGNELLARTVPDYWDTWEVDVPVAVLRTGKNVLAFECHPYDDSTKGAIYTTRPSHALAPGSIVHVLSNDGPDPIIKAATGIYYEGPDKTTTTRQDIAFANLKAKLAATRPDSKSRMYWPIASIDSVGWGFSNGSSPEGFGYVPDRNKDDGPGVWGYGGHSHQPEFVAYTTGGPYGTRTAGGAFPVKSPAHWWVRDEGFGGVLSSPPVWRITRMGGYWDFAGVATSTDALHYAIDGGFKVGDIGAKLTVDRFNMIGVGRLGGGGYIQASMTFDGSDEWGPGASYLLSYGIEGGGRLERTVLNQEFQTGPGTPTGVPPANADAATLAAWQDWYRGPLFSGQVIATAAVNNPQQVFVSVTSTDPTGPDLGKARIWVYWLDADDQRAGLLANDNELLHAAFGTQPAMLDPYSENMFWTATYFGTGPWTTAKKIQVVAFQHPDNPNGRNTWLVDITVREATVVKRVHPVVQWA